MGKHKKFEREISEEDLNWASFLVTGLLHDQSELMGIAMHKMGIGELVSHQCLYSTMTTTHSRCPIISLCISLSFNFYLFLEKFRNGLGCFHWSFFK